MLAINCRLDFELCKNILLWLEKALASEDIALFNIEGYTPQDISYNAHKLHKRKLIEVKGPKKSADGTLIYFPIGFTPNGRRFLEAAKDEAIWTEAKKIAEAQNEADDNETLGPLKAALFAGGS